MRCLSIAEKNNFGLLEAEEARKSERFSILTFFLNYGLNDMMYVVVDMFVENCALVNDSALYVMVNL